MVRLPRSALEAVLAFLGDASQLEFDELYPTEFLARLQELVPATWVLYQEADHRIKSFPLARGIGPDAGDDDDDDDERIYWTYGPCPTQDHRMRTGDLGAVRTSDLIGPRVYHQLPIYREYFRPVRIEHIMDLGLPASPGRTRSLVFMRDTGAPDFSERDRDVIEMLRPHLYHIEAHAGLRHELAEALAGPLPSGRGGLDRCENGNGGGLYSMLTHREREIVELVATGKTNAEIAATLWVAPSTVKKHLENVYAKTGIGRRAAVAALRREPSISRQ